MTEQYGYDANRMQLTSQKTGTASPYTNRMDLTYSYAATSGQMGSGTTAGNAGQLMSISGTIGGVTESAAYTYDNLGRLVTSNQTSNTSSAQRRFAYDRWGNRTGMWDAVSGGNQIQSITLQQSGGAPTNQIGSMTSGSTVNYTYDAAGNVTNDAVHSYGYDSENRVVSVDAGSTASYAYDHDNQRYKKTFGGIVTHYVWEDSQVLAEYNGTTGATLIDYVYYGSRMIAKIASGATQYFLSDRLSVRLSLDSSGNVLGRQSHLPFGEDFGESGTQEKHHFTTYERDPETSTDDGVNRHYYQALGRFSRPDATSDSYDYADAQSLNRYNYGTNDPINQVDPLGSLDFSVDTQYRKYFKKAKKKVRKRYSECRASYFGSSGTNLYATLPTEEQTVNIITVSRLFITDAAWVASIWGRESDTKDRPTGDHGPAQLTRWWERNHPELIVPGAYDYADRGSTWDPIGKRWIPDPRPFAGDVEANLLTLANIARFTYSLYKNDPNLRPDGPYYKMAYWYGPGPPIVDRDQYAREVMSLFSTYQLFFGCVLQ